MAALLDEYLEININIAAQDHPDIFQREAFTVFTAGAILIGRDICRLLATDPAVLEEVRSILINELAKKEQSMLIRQILETHRSKRYDEVWAALKLLENTLK